MSSLVKNPMAKKTEIVQSVVPVAVGEAIRSDAADGDCSSSLVIRRVLKGHYAKRLKRRAAQ